MCNITPPSLSLLPSLLSAAVVVITAAATSISADNPNTTIRGHPSISLPLLSYYPPHLPLSICILPTPWYHLPGPHSKADDFPIQSPTTFQKSTHQMSSTSNLLFHLYLSRIRRVLDALGQVCVTLRHPPLSRGQLFMGGLVLGSLVLYFSVYHL
jgi:hypothetical protein